MTTLPVMKNNILSLIENEMRYYHLFIIIFWPRQAIIIVCIDVYIFVYRISKSSPQSILFVPYVLLHWYAALSREPLLRPLYTYAIYIGVLYHVYYILRFC